MWRSLLRVNLVVFVLLGFLACENNVSKVSGKQFDLYFPISEYTSNENRLSGKEDTVAEYVIKLNLPSEFKQVEDSITNEFTQWHTTPLCFYFQDTINQQYVTIKLQYPITKYFTYFEEYINEKIARPCWDKRDTFLKIFPSNFVFLNSNNASIDLFTNFKEDEVFSNIEELKYNFISETYTFIREQNQMLDSFEIDGKIVPRHILLTIYVYSKSEEFIRKYFMTRKPLDFVKI